MKGSQLNKRLLMKGIFSIIMVGPLFFANLALACISSVSANKCSEIGRQGNCCEYSAVNESGDAACILNCTWSNDACIAAANPEITCG